MHDSITCRVCGATIGPELWRLFAEHATCQPPPPPVEALAVELRQERWQAEKTITRALKTLDQWTRPHGRGWRPGHRRRSRGVRGVGYASSLLILNQQTITGAGVSRGYRVAEYQQGVFVVLVPSLNAASVTPQWQLDTSHGIPWASSQWATQASRQLSTIWQQGGR